MLLFVVTNIVKLIYSVFEAQEDIKITVIRLFSLVIICLLSWFSHKEHRICTVVLAIIIAVRGLATIAISFSVGFDQAVLKLIFLLLGCYFAYGGIILFKHPKKIA